MSKKDRVKANAKPAKSDAAASLLGTSQAFIGFDTQDSFVLAPEIHAHLKKLSKKDSNTKIKSLQDLTEIIPSNDNLTWVNLIPQWCRFYPKLCTDEDTMVRKNSHIFHTLIVTRTKKDFTPYLKQVAGYWLLSMFDPYPPAAREAKTSFFSTFPDDKWRKVLLFCKTEIFELLSDLLNSDMSTLDGDQEKASLKFYRLTSQSLALVVFLLQSEASGFRESMRSEIIPKLIQQNAKFIKLIELPDTAVQKNCVALLGELIKEDMDSIFDIEAQSGVTLKPLENVALNEMDVNIVEDVWKIILQLEKSKMFCRTAKHEKQWLSKINQLVISRFEHISFVSKYVIFSSGLETPAKLDWFSCLSSELTHALQDKSTRIPILNEFIRSVFDWLRDEYENTAIDIIVNLMTEMREDPSHVLFESEFSTITHKYSINNERLCSRVVEFLSKCFQGLSPEEETSAIFLDRFLKLEKTVKRVRIDPTPVPIEKCGKIREVYFCNLSSSEKLVSDSFAVLDLCITICSEIFAQKDGDFKFSSDQFIKMIEKCLQDSDDLSSRSTNICKLAALSDFSATQYEEVFKHISDSKIICQIVTTELQMKKGSLLESNILLNLLSNSCYASTLKIVYDNLDKVKPEQRQHYVALLPKFSGDDFFDLSEVLLNKLTGPDSNTSRKNVYRSILNRSDLILDSKLFSLTDSYLKNGTDIADLKELFLFFSNPKSGNVLTRLQVRSLCRKLFSAAGDSQKEEFSKFCLKTLNDMLVEKTTSFKDALRFLFELNGFMIPEDKFRSQTINDFPLEDFDHFTSFIKDIHQLSLEVTEKADPTMSQWLSDIRVLSNVLVPLKVEHPMELAVNSEILLVRGTEIFKLISRLTSQNDVEMYPELENSEDLPEKELRAVFDEVSLEEVTDYLLEIGTKSVLPVTFAKFMRVLMHVEDYLWDGFNLSVHQTRYLLLNRQILYGMEVQLKNLNESIGIDKLVELWDTFMCSLACYGKNVAITSQEKLFDNPLYLSYGHVFMNCYAELVTLVDNLEGDEFVDAIDEWDEVLRAEFEECVCTYGIKLIKSDLSDRFFTKKFTEYASLHSAITTNLQDALNPLVGESSYVSYISPGLLSRNFKIQTLAADVLEKCIIETETFDLQSVKMLLEVAEMSSVGYQLMQSMADLQEGPPERIEVADPETHSSVSTFIRSHQLVFHYLSKEKPSAINEILQNEIPHLNYDLFLSFLLCLIDYQYDYSNVSLLEISPETVTKDANSLPYLAARCLLSILINTPNLCQNWFEKLDRRRRETADYFISKFLSPVIIKRAFDEINADNSSDNSDNRLTIKTFLGERIVRAQYCIEDFAVDVKLSYAKNYPLGRISIEEIKKKKIGVKDEEWQRLLLDLKISLEQETVSLVSGIIKWKKTLEQIFEGVEECCVCMAVVHPSNRSLPSKPCKVCKKKFHGVCLFTWFEKGTANCPYCRSVF